MDWRNYQFWRKKLRRVDETTAEFDVLIQRTNQRIVIGERLRDTIQLLEGTSPIIKKISGWRDFTRNAYDTGKSLFFRKKICLLYTSDAADE